MHDLRVGDRVSHGIGGNAGESELCEKGGDHVSLVGRVSKDERVVSSKAAVGARQVGLLFVVSGISEVVETDPETAVARDAPVEAIDGV